MPSGIATGLNCSFLAAGSIFGLKIGNTVHKLAICVIEKIDLSKANCW